MLPAGYVLVNPRPESEDPVAVEKRVWQLQRPAEPAGRAGSGLTSTAVQRRTLRLLFSTQVLCGVGMAFGVSVGALVAADLSGVGGAGLPAGVMTVGAAAIAVPVARIMRQYGRRPGLVTAYLAAAAGASMVVTAAATASVPLLFAGFFLAGGAITANLQARHAAVDLAPPSRRARHLSVVIWASTVGTVVGPNLAPLASTALAGLGGPPLAGPFVFSAALYGVAAVLIAGLLRPDPLQVVRGRRGPGRAYGAGPGLREALGVIAGRPQARLAIAAPAVGWAVMTAVMVMTPVHIRGAGYGPEHTLRVVGVVLSVHIAGMYALAPVLGILADRCGRRPVITGGVGLLVVACAVAGSAGHHPVRLTAGLFLLGVGWSALLVAGSALLNEVVPEPQRPSAQALMDVAALSAAAAAAAASGLVVAWSGYPTLTLLAAALAVPLLALALRPGSGVRK